MANRCQSMATKYTMAKRCHTMAEMSFDGKEIYIGKEIS